VDKHDRSEERVSVQIEWTGDTWRLAYQTLIDPLGNEEGP
jgi:hypothetical protein